MATNNLRFSLTTFSSEGKLTQIDGASAAVAQGAATIGIKAVDGVVLISEKRLRSVLIDASTIEKIAIIHPSCALTYAGRGPDFRLILKRTRKYAASYKMTYDEDPPVAVVAKFVAETFQEYTQNGGVRPFGVSVLVGGIDAYSNEPVLYQADASGAYWPWVAAAIGRHRISAVTSLERRFNATDSLSDAVPVALTTLKDAFEGEMTSTNVEVAIASRGADGPSVRVLSAEEVGNYLKQLE